MGKSKVTEELKKEILEVFKDTDSTCFEGKCNISFQAFLVANYAKETLLSSFPLLSTRYRMLTDGE